MILLDTNVLIYASEPLGDYRDWSRETIATAVAGEGAAINAVTLAELCVGDREPHTLADRIRSWGVGVIDLPVALAPVCALAYVDYLRHRKATAAKRIGRVPLPDFFIGAHAAVAELDQVLPESWSKGNPVDIIGDAPPERLAGAVRALLDHPHDRAEPWPVERQVQVQLLHFGQVVHPGGQAQ